MQCYAYFTGAAALPDAAPFVLYSPLPVLFEQKQFNIGCPLSLGWKFVAGESIGLLTQNSAQNSGVGGPETRLEKSEYYLFTSVPIDGSAVAPSLRGQ